MVSPRRRRSGAQRDTARALPPRGRADRLPRSWRTATAKTIFARTLVFATGIEGNGVRYVPEFITQHIPKERWAHTQEADRLRSLARQDRRRARRRRVIVRQRDPRGRARRDRARASPRQGVARLQSDGLGGILRLPRALPGPSAGRSLALLRAPSNVSRRVHRIRRCSAPARSEPAHSSGRALECRAARRRPHPHRRDRRTASWRTSSSPARATSSTWR